MDENLIVYAMEKSIENKKKNMNYILTILKNWKNQGYTKRIQAEQEYKSYKSKNSNNTKNKNKNDNTKKDDEDWGDFYDNLVKKEGWK